MINIDYVHGQILEVTFGYIIVYWDDNLLLQKAPCGHVDVGLWFVIVPVDQFLNLVNLLILKMRKYFFDFQSVQSNVRG